MPGAPTATDQKRVCRSCSAVLSRYNQDSLCMPCAGTKRREKLEADLAAQAGTPVTPAIRAEANTIAEHLERRSSFAGPPKPEGQRWCEGCQKYRFAGAFLPSGDCRSCVGPKPEASPSWEVVVTKPTQDLTEDVPNAEPEPAVRQEEATPVVAEPVPEAPAPPAPVQAKVRPLARLAFNDQGEIEDVANYQTLHEMLALLPKDGRWKPRQRALWLRALTSLLDYLVDEPPCESVGHHACQHYVMVAQKGIESSAEVDWCFGCAAERPYDGATPRTYEHTPDCPLAAIVKGEL